MPDKSRLLDQVRDKIRLKHYSIRTEEQAYVDWIKRFILFHDSSKCQNSRSLFFQGHDIKKFF